ncbi:hypothetical protein ABTY96_30625 [Streptomyces sp. NPDC096057]|uniref:hypothetical protein n=1 Tax=Streptomyces sp. NPDC096057 TaxID=3155543 RepID=UPI00331E27BF
MLACWFGVDRSTVTRAIGEIQRCTAAPPPPTPGCGPRRSHRPSRRKRAGRDHRRHRNPGPSPGRRTQGQ